MIRKFFTIFLVLSLPVIILVLSLPLFLFGRLVFTSYWEYNAKDSEIISPDGQVYEMVEEITLSPNAQLGEEIGEFYGGLLDSNVVVSIPGLSSKEWVIEVFEGTFYLYKKKGMTPDQKDLEKLKEVGVIMDSQ